jgi:leader peptidase (prepilin peptidase)/N-methyltransferase
VNAVPVICALVSLPAAWFGGVLVDRVPDNEPLRPLPGVRLRGWYVFLYVSMLVTFTLMGVRFEHESPLVIGGYLLVTGMLLTVSVIDISLYRLPDRIVLPTFVVSFALVVVESVRAGESARIEYALAGAAFYFGFLLIVHLISPRGMGFGDVKLAAVMGLYVGWMGADYTTSIALVLWAMLVGFVVGSVVGIGLLAARRRNAAIPFGPFLALGTITVVLLAPHLVAATLSI